MKEIRQRTEEEKRRIADQVSAHTITLANTMSVPPVQIKHDREETSHREARPSVNLLVELATVDLVLSFPHSTVHTSMDQDT